MSDKGEYLVVGIDPSLNSTGITILNQDNKIIHVEAIHPSPLDGRDRLAYIYKSYMRIFTTFNNIKVIAFERQIPQERFNYNAKYILSLAENIGVLKLAIQEAVYNNPNIKVYHFSAPEIKKYATGNSKASKEDVMATIGARPMKTLSSSVVEWAVNDVCDAYYAAKMGGDVYEGTVQGEFISI